MSVIPPENTDRLEHEKQHEAEAHHYKQGPVTTQHHENMPPINQADEKSHGTNAVFPANSDSEQGSGNPEMQTKTVWTFRTLVATAGLSGLYVGSQIPLYFVGGSLSFIAADLGGTEVSAWLSVAYALALSAIAPFSGYLQDLIGRRNVTLVGGASLMLGCIVLATAKHFGQGIVGMGFAGAGAAIGELTALAG